MGAGEALEVTFCVRVGEIVVVTEHREICRDLPIDETICVLPINP